MSWRSVQLNEVAQVQGGRTPKGLDRFLAAHERSDRRIPFYKVGDMNASSVLRTSRTWLAADEISEFGLDTLPEGTVVFPKAGGAIATNKKRSIEVPGAVDLNCMAVIPGPLLEARYLRLWFESFDLTSVADGSVLPQISKNRASQLRIPLPSLAEQRRIVATLEDHLSRLDAADASLATATARLAAFDRASLDAHFGLGDGAVALGELVTDISAGKSFGAATAPAREDEWGIIKVSAMTWGEFKPEENKAIAADRVDRRFEIRKGDLLVSRANTSDYVGASVLVRDVRPKLLLSDKSLRITPRDDVDPSWLWRALQAPSARRQISALATGTKESMRNISQTSLLMIKLPKRERTAQLSALESYESLGQSVAAARTAVAVQQRRSAALRRSLLAAAFSGRLTGAASDLSAAEEMVGA